ncbi:hypothetical protein Tco_0090877 [Tanacetum coccineum]
MGGSSSQPRSPINAFPIEELYTPEFSESLQENTGYWQQPGPYEATTQTSPTKKKKATRNRQKRQNDDVPRQVAWTTEEEITLAKGWKSVYENERESEDASINLNNTVADDDEMTNAEVEQREAFIELKRREVQCREREIAATEYRAQQEDMKLYLQPYDHFTGEEWLRRTTPRLVSDGIVAWGTQSRDFLNGGVTLSAGYGPLV